MRPGCGAGAGQDEEGPPPRPPRPHLVPRCEGGQLLDLGGLMVAASPAQQHLAAHPLWLRRGAGGCAAHHVVQVLQVLGGDGLVVVAILGDEGGRGPESAGEPHPCGQESRLRPGVRTEAPSSDTPGKRWRILNLSFLYMSDRSFSSEETSHGALSVQPAPHPVPPGTLPHRGAQVQPAGWLPGSARVSPHQSPRALVSVLSAAVG